MTVRSISPARKALLYAEQELSVHKVYEKALQDREDLDAVFTDLSSTRDEKRAVDGKIQMREMDLLGDEQAKHPGMSVAAMDRHMKDVLHKDEQVQKLRANLVTLINKLDGLEYDKSILETDIKIGVARMTELGGYLSYLAVIKLNSNLTEKTGAT